MGARCLVWAVLFFSGVALLLGGAHHCRHALQVLGLPRRAGLLFAASAPQREAGSLSAPLPTCEHLDCPPFRPVHEESDFEIREYSAAKWAETDPLLDASFDKATGSGFRSLFQYIQGKNEDEVSIPMTAPVLTTIKPSGGPFCSSSFTVRFFVPPQFSEKTPKPSEGLGVNIASLPKRCVAVRRFPGFATDFNVAQEAKLLADSLERTAWANVTSLHGREEVYAIAQYNSPFEIFNRVNEVWVAFAPEEGKDDCTPAVDSAVKPAIALAMA